MPGRPTIWMIVGQGPIALAVRAGGGCLDIFTLRYLFSPLSPSLWEAARYRLKYCLKGSLNPKQPTKIPFDLSLLKYLLNSRGWSGGAMVLGKLPVPGRPTIWFIVGQGLLRLQYVREGVVWTFLLSSIFTLLFLPLFGRRPDID